MHKHYKIDDIQGRHFVHTVQKAGLPDDIAKEAFEEIPSMTKKAMQSLEQKLPSGFPEEIHASVMRGMKLRLNSL